MHYQTATVTSELDPAPHNYSRQQALYRVISGKSARNDAVTHHRR
jgi:hypothetical protein